MRKWRRKLSAVAVAGVLVGVGTAFLASGTVPASSAGEGSGSVTVTTTGTTGQVTSVSTPAFQVP